MAAKDHPQSLPTPKTALPLRLAIQMDAQGRLVMKGQDKAATQAHRRSRPPRASAADRATSRGRDSKTAGRERTSSAGGAKGRERAG